MENLTLTAIILEPKNAEYSEQYRALTTQEGEGFTVGIKEYIDGKKELTEKIEILKTEKKTIASDLLIEKNSLFDQATRRYKDGGDWIKLENHNGKEVTHAEVSMDENIKKAIAKAGKLQTQKDTQITTLKDDLAKFETSFDSVVWAWNLAYSRSGLSATRNFAYDKGLKEITLVLYQHLQGGGFAWVEPFFEGSKPTCSTKNGLFVHTIGTSSEIVTAEWYGYDKDKKPVKINQPIAPTDKVQLHIYTKSMYGQNIGVELKANGKTLKASSYSNNLYLYASKNPNTKPKESETKYEVMDSKELFLAEVEVYDYSDPNSIQPPAGAITGSLVISGDDFADGSIKSLPNVQKAVLDLYIDPAWCFGVPEITINPTIHFGETIKTLAAPLKVLGHKNPDMRIPETGNMPVYVDKVETNFQEFQHCRYDIITGSYAKLDNRDQNEPIEIELFNSELISERSILTMPVIAGNKQARRNVKIKTDAVTTECIYEDDKNLDHTHKVFDLSLIQEAIVIEESHRVDEHLMINKPNFSLIYDRIKFTKEEEGHGDTNDDNEINASHTTVKQEIKSPVGISATSKSTIYKDERKIGKYPNSDTEIVVDVGFEYKKSLINYIWPIKETVIQNYPILIHTCAYPEKTLNIAVYPDIKWIVQFAYDCDPEEFQEMRKDEYDKYLVKIENLEGKYKPEKLEDKISRIDVDIENARETSKTAKKEKKKNAQKLISKLEQKKAKQQSKQKKYNKKSSNAKKTYKSDRPDLFNFKDNISSGLSDLVLSLNVEYDRPGEATEISASYKRYINLVKQLIDVKNTIELILDGKKKSQKKLDKKFKEIDEVDANEKLKNMGDALKGRPLLSVDIIPPSLAFLGSWYAESPKDININQVGIVGEIQIMAKPFIGAAITMDFLALAQKAHPIARGIITLIDFADAAGVGPKITLEMEVSGELEIEGKFMYNSASTTTNFNRNSLSQDSEDDSPLTVSGVLKLEITGKIEFSKKANSYIFGSVTAYANAGFEVKTGLTLSGAIKADNKGFFIDPLLTFHGLIVSGVAEAGYKVENSDGGEYFSDSIEDSFELVLMHEYEGSFENSQGEKIQLYLT